MEELRTWYSYELSKSGWRFKRLWSLVHLTAQVNIVSRYIETYHSTNRYSKGNRHCACRFAGELLQSLCSRISARFEQGICQLRAVLVHPGLSPITVAINTFNAVGQQIRDSIVDTLTSWIAFFGQWGHAAGGGRRDKNAKYIIEKDR